MSDQEKPLHVRVAEALGWTDLTEGPPMLPGDEPTWLGMPPVGDSSLILSAVDHKERVVTLTMGIRSVYRYDLDWSKTGPLIERFLVMVHPPASIYVLWGAITSGGSLGRDVTEPAQVQAATGRTPQIAVCNLILALAAAGKLEVPNGA
jgi:hypothetical protein